MASSLYSFDNPSGGAPIGRFTTTLGRAELYAACSKVCSSFALVVTSAFSTSSSTFLSSFSVLLVVRGDASSASFAVPSKLCDTAMSFFTADDFFLRGGNVRVSYVTWPCIFSLQMISSCVVGTLGRDILHSEDRALRMTVMIVLMPQ